MGDITESGSVESSLREVIKEQGTLTGAQHTLAAAALVLARELDIGHGVSENVARELRMTVASLVGIQQGATGAVPQDSISALQDEVARKRQERKKA